MNLLNIEGISKSYGEKLLLSDISFNIEEGDKIGIIGINGTGKSTLLKIIAGREQGDSGNIIKGNMISIGYLPQNPYFDLESSVLSHVFSSDLPVMKLIREYEEALQRPEASQNEIIKLTRDMDALNAWNVESEAKTVLTKLGITDFTARIGELSGGQRKRVALAAALINPSDLLILDEPTNHLDNTTIDWLEQYLNRRKGALLMVTHDRYFLDRIVNQIIELDRGNLYTYKGSYHHFLERKLEREEMEAASERKRHNLLKKELAWIQRGAKARSTKQKARIDRFHELEGQGNYSQRDKLQISVTGSRLGRKIIELDHISKAFDGKCVIDDFSYIVLRDDRIGIIGPNGIGKTTLINILADRLKPDAGKVDMGDTVRIGLYSQETFHMDEEQRVIEYIRDAGEYVTNGEGEKITASQMLEQFLFPSAAQWTFISQLSGGEKRRLYLLRVLMEAPNILLLDEPTNDLDIETLTILEDYIDHFQGAVIAVSHDRYFLDRAADKIFVFEGQGRITQHTGNYTSYMDDDNPLDTGNTSSYEKERKEQEKEDRKKIRPLKFSFKEQKEYEEIDDVIAGLEDKLQEMESKINDAASDYTLLQQLLLEKEELENELEQRMERWVYLNELAEKIKLGVMEESQ